MPENVEQLWDAISRIGSGDATGDKIAPEVIAKLIKFKFVELTTTGLPQLTGQGVAAYASLESGDGGGDFPELESRRGFA